MDFEQIAQRLEYLEDERRKDKLVISTLEERIMKLEGDLTPALHEQQELSDELSRLRSMMPRFDQVEGSVAKLRVDLSKMIDAVEKAQVERDRDAEKSRIADVESLNLAIKAVRDELDILPSLQNKIKSREVEETRLNRLVAELDKKILDAERSDEEYIRAQKIMEETLRQNSKKVVDIQGEVSTIRKRVEESRGKVDLVNETLKKLEMRQNELMSAEVERKQNQTAFMDKHNLLQVDRDRVWREWENRFELVDKQSVSLTEQLQALDETHREIRQSKEAFDDITLRFDRRINEITEMQRLVEDRFRQEWVSFKADDQKRWSNYLLTTDETNRETNRQFDKFENRLVNLEDHSQDMQDTLSQITQELKKRLQRILILTRELTEDFDDNFDLKSV